MRKLRNKLCTACSKLCPVNSCPQVRGYLSICHSKLIVQHLDVHHKDVHHNLNAAMSSDSSSVPCKRWFRWRLLGLVCTLPPKIHIYASVAVSVRQTVPSFRWFRFAVWSRLLVLRVGVAFALLGASTCACRYLFGTLA